MEDEFEEFDTIEERNDKPRFSFKPNWWAIGGTVLAGVVIKQVFFKSDPKFDDTDQPAGEVNEAKVQAMASELFELFDNATLEFIDRPRCEALGRYVKFSNAELVAVANFYKNKFNKTIRQTLADLYFKPCAFWEVDHMAHLLVRFGELNIP